LCPENGELTASDAAGVPEPVQSISEAPKADARKRVSSPKITAFRGQFAAECRELKDGCNDSGAMGSRGETGRRFQESG
jgi:hypothetical protein